MGVLKKVFLFLFISTFILIAQDIRDQCTSIIVTKGATEDGSVIITYAADNERIPKLNYTSPADHEEGSTES